MAFLLSLPSDLMESAFLVKIGEQYSLVSLTSEGKIRAEVYASLPAAQAAMAAAGLEVTATHRSALALEKLWAVEQGQRTVVYWKLRARGYLQRLSFQNREDAHFFLAAIQSGAYSPSPHGHSLFLRRR